MTEPMSPDSGPGWGESLPLPLTPQSSPTAGRAEAAQAGQHASAHDEAHASPREEGGPKGLEPTRYNDWEQKGRCTDF